MRPRFGPRSLGRHDPLGHPIRPRSGQNPNFAPNGCRVPCPKTTKAPLYAGLPSYGHIQTRTGDLSRVKRTVVGERPPPADHGSLPQAPPPSRPLPEPRPARPGAHHRHRRSQPRDPGKGWVGPLDRKSSEPNQGPRTKRQAAGRAGAGRAVAPGPGRSPSRSRRDQRRVRLQQGTTAPTGRTPLG